MPESSATSMANKQLAAAVDTSAAAKTTAAAAKTTDKATSASTKKTTAAAAPTTDFQNAATTTTTTKAAATSTKSSTSTHSTSAATVASSAPSSSMLPITVSTPSSSLAVTTTSATALPTATNSDSSSSSTSVAGPVVGSIAGVAVIGAIAFFFIRRRNKMKKNRANHAFSQFLNEAPPHHGTGNVRDSMWGMPSKASEKEVNSGYAISPPPPPEKAYNPEFGSPPPVSPPAAYSAYDPHHHVSPPTSPNAAGYGGPGPQASYGNVSPPHMGHNAAIAGAAAVATAAAAGTMASHQQQYPNEVNGDMPLADPYKQQGQQSPQQHAGNLGDQENAYYNQHQSPQRQHPEVVGQQNAYYSDAQQYQQQPGDGYNQQYPDYQQGYAADSQQYYDPNSQQYGYTSQPYSNYNSMYIGTDQSYFQDDPDYQNNYPAAAATNVFGQYGNTSEHTQQQSYEMMPQPSLTPPAETNQVEAVQSTSQSESTRDVQAPSTTTAPNSVTPAPPTLFTTDYDQSTPSIEHYADHNTHTPVEQKSSQSGSVNPYVLDVPIVYNSDPARETLYGLSEHYQYGGDDTDDGQELSSGHQTTQPPHPPAHKGDLM
ncbi:hypothetical protein BGW37DRAFT_206373 [Umbelopsis sp. PMI_123]|nr:hypothetical protein BGW37DRAFT_206373 [Umbelopsis sp. PMI_123]